MSSVSPIQPNHSSGHSPEGNLAPSGAPAESFTIGTPKQANKLPSPMELGAKGKTAGKDYASNPPSEEESIKLINSGLIPPKQIPMLINTAAFPEKDVIAAINNGKFNDVGLEVMVSSPKLPLSEGHAIFFVTFKQQIVQNIMNNSQQFQSQYRQAANS